MKEMEADKSRAVVYGKVAETKEKNKKDQTEKKGRLTMAAMY